MRSLKLYLGLIALALTFIVPAQELDLKSPDLSEEIPVDSKIRVGKLDNGLTYFIRKNEKPEERVQFRLVVKAGSVLEDDNQLGLAHFVEHMAFNGSDNFEKNEL